MKVRVSITLDIEPKAWALDYGIEGAPAIRADVQEHAAQTLREYYRSLGLLKEN